MTNHVSAYVSGQGLGFVLFFIGILINSQTNGERVDQKIYTHLQSDHYCVRRLNNTHQFGCTSEPGGNVGVLWMVRDESDIEHVLTEGPTPPYVAVMGQQHFTLDNIIKFKASYPSRISGVILIKQNATANSIPFSTDSVCPNQYTGLYTNNDEFANCKQQPWQTRSSVTDLFYQDIPFPIFLMTKEETIAEINSCFSTHNQGTKSKQADYPLCSAQLDTFMSAAKDSEYCLYGRATIDEIFQLQSSRCRPINKNNIFGYFKDSVGIKPANNTPLVANRSIVMITSRMDSMSFFSHLAPGADSAITGLVVLLSVAQTLAKFKKSGPAVKSQRNIAFAIFDAESFDYTGSGRMAYDMKKGRLLRYYNSNAGKEAINNMDLNGIDAMIELNQLAPYPDSGDSVYIHTDPENYIRNSKKLDKIISKLKNSNQPAFIKVNQTMPLPPASLQSFLKYDQEIAGLVVTNHQKEFTNLFYHSVFDDPSNINKTLNNGLVTRLTNVATAVARGAYKLAFDADDDSITTDPEIVKQLLECYLISSDCELITASTEHAKGSIFKGPIDTYDSTFNSMVSQLLLSYFLADKELGVSAKECEEKSSQSLTHRYIYINGDNTTKGGVCIKFQVLRTASLSPAFQYEEVELNETMSREFSTWTESDTNIRNPVRLFFKPSPSLEWVTFSAGLALSIFSFVIVSFVHKLILKQHQTSSA